MKRSLFLSCVWMENGVLVGFAANWLKNTESLTYARAE